MSAPDVERREKAATVIGWIGLLLAGTLCGIVAFVLDTMILWDHATGCDPGPADPDQMFAGRMSMAVVLLVVLGVWVIAWVGLSRRRSAVVASALLATVPALGYLAYGLDPDSWIGGLCIQF